MYYYDNLPPCIRETYNEQNMQQQQLPSGMMPQWMPYMPQQQQYPGMIMNPQQTGEIPMPYLPTGVPAGPTTGDVLNPEQTVLSTDFTQGYLRTQIGKKVKVEFLIGTDMFIDREGTLLEVGASYIIIRETGTNDRLLCDMYSIKFVKFYTNPNIN